MSGHSHNVYFMIYLLLHVMIYIVLQRVHYYIGYVYNTFIKKDNF